MNTRKHNGIKLSSNRYKVGTKNGIQEHRHNVNSSLPRAEFKFLDQAQELWNSVKLNFSSTPLVNGLPKLDRKKIALNELVISGNY